MSLAKCVYCAVDHVFLAVLKPKWGALPCVSHFWSWSCSAFPCRQDSHWFPGGHVQARAAGSVPTMVKIDSYLLVFIKRRRGRALYNRRAFWGALVYLKPPVIAALPDRNWLHSRVRKLGSCHCWRAVLFSLLADNKPHSRHAKELGDKQPKQRNSKWGLVLGSLVFAYACKGEADTTGDAAALCQCSCSLGWWESGGRDGLIATCANCLPLLAKGCSNCPLLTHIQASPTERVHP